MGLKLGRLFKKAAPFIGAAAGGFFGGPGGAQAGFRLGAALRPTSRAAMFAGGGIGAGVPSIQEVTGIAPFLPLAARNGEIVPAAAGAVTPFAIVGMSRAVAMAITKIAVALGIPLTLAKLSRVGLRVWRTINTFARRHPGISILTWLASLGLLADEAAEFMLWGQAKQRRRRGRGISARDIRICRRTIRKMSAFRRDLGGIGMRRAPGRRAIGRGTGGVVIAQQD